MSPQPILPSVLLALLLGLNARAQTTVSAPAPDSGACEAEECPSVPPSADSGRPRTYPYRSWEFDDVATSGELERAGGLGGKGGEKPPISSSGIRPKDETPAAETEFQKFVFRSTGMHLPIYGQSVFRDVPSTFAGNDRIPVPADYTLGMGDHLLIHVWGQVDINSRVIVDRNGQIFLPKVGMITVSGQRYDQLADYLKTAFGRLFRHFDLSVSLGQMRTIQVLVVGRARRPGSYSVSSLSTLVNALFRSGGPANNGSMRHIALRRQGRVFCEFDLYDLLLKGDKSKDAALESGDVIYIPPVGPEVALAGSINQPAIYEIAAGATVREQIAAAGGLSSTADDTRALLERIDEHSGRNVEEFALDGAGQSRELRDGDVLRIFPVSPRFQNAVTLRGNVARPGRYPWRAGMRITDIIASPDAVVSPAYWVQQNALGRAPPGWIEGAGKKPVGKQNGDVPSPAEENNPPAKPDLEPPQTEAGGPDRDVQALPARTRMERGYAEVNWDYAVVERLDPSDLSTRLLPFDLGRALAQPGSADNLALEPGDVVTVFSQRDLSVPVAKRTQLVWVEGEVRASGIYRAEPGETLPEIVQRAGGLTPQAFLFAADFRRESTRQEQEQELQRMVDEMDRELRSKVQKLSLSASPEDRAAGREELERERAVIDKLKQTHPTGRIVLELKATDSDVRALPPLPLQDGDRIRIPPRAAFVEVSGQVYNQSAFLFRSGRSLGDYLRQAGGATPDADAARVFVIRADGSVLSKQMHRSVWAGSFESLKLVPGDTIVMPERIRTGGLLRGLRDWSQVFSQFALGAAAVKVLSP